MANVSIVPVAHCWSPIQKVNLTELMTQPPTSHQNLVSLRIDDSLSINRLVLLSSGFVVDVWVVEVGGFAGQKWV